MIKFTLYTIPLSRSRSIRELEECRKPPTSSTSAYSQKMLPPARASASSATNISSLREKLAAVKTVSSSSSHLASPVTPRRRFLMQTGEQRTHESAVLGPSAIQRTSLSSSPYTSSSSSTSYLLSPRPVR